MRANYLHSKNLKLPDFASVPFEGTVWCPVCDFKYDTFIGGAIPLPDGNWGYPTFCDNCGNTSFIKLPLVH